MKLLLTAVAASALLAPALTASVSAGHTSAKGNAYGQHKVCLVTFQSSAARQSQADAGVVDAQYMPLPAAMRKEARSDDVSDIYTYNETTQRSGVDFNIVGGTMTTEETCAYLDNLAEEDDDA